MLKNYVPSRTLEKHGLLRTGPPWLLSCKHCYKTNSMCRCTIRKFLTSDRISARDARDLCPDSLSKCANCLNPLDEKGNKSCDNVDPNCRNLENSKTIVTNKQFKRVSDAVVFKQECDHSAVEDIRRHTQATTADPQDIITLSDDPSGEEMNENWNPDNNLPDRFHENVSNQLPNLPDDETTARGFSLRKKRKTHSQIGQNGHENSSIFQNHPDQLDSKSQVMLETQNTSMSKNAMSTNQGVADESQSSTTVPARDRQPFKREFNIEVNNNHVESEESDIDLSQSSNHEIRKFIDCLRDKNKRLLFQNQNDQEQIEKLEARLKKVRKKKNESLQMKDEIILNMSIAAKSKNGSKN